MIFTFIFSNCFTVANENILCINENATLECLKKEFDELYRTDYKSFWDILNDAAKRVQNFRSIPDVVEFMELDSVIEGNVEVSEFFSEVIEKFCTSHPESCFEAIICLDKDSKKIIINRLRQPIFVNKNEIDSIFFRYKSSLKYKDVMNLYFNQQ